MTPDAIIVLITVCGAVVLSVAKELPIHRDLLPDLGVSCSEVPALVMNAALRQHPT